MTLALAEHGQQLVQSMVQHALLERVGYDGRPSTSERDPTRLHKLMGHEIGEAAKRAIASWVETHRDEFARAIEAELQRRRKSLAKDMVDVFAQVLSNSYRLTLTLGSERIER